MSSTSECDSPAIASSAMRSLGSAAMARASSSLRISIWVRSRGRRSAFASRPDERQQLGAARRRSSPSPRLRPVRALDRVEQRNAQVLRHRHAAERPRQLEAAREAEPRALVRPAARSCRWPSNCTVPVSFRSVPEMQLTSVLLPEPLGPMRPSRSPARDLRDRCRRARRSRRSACRASSIRSSGSLTPPSAAPRSNRPTMPLGATTTNPTISTPTMSRFERRRDGDGRDLLDGAEEDRADHRPDPVCRCRRSAAWRCCSPRTAG